LNKRIEELMDAIKALEKDLREEFRRIRIDTYEIRDRTVRFKDDIARHHKSQAIGLFAYIRHAKLKHIVTAPVIWCCIFPALFMDLVITLYQAICFPVYGIPKVKRRDYIVVDRHYLRYLNIVQKINCMFCSYFNGLVAYTAEIGARTEQYWCPIKHASQVKVEHSRYKRFLEYGDADKLQHKIMQLRGDFDDLKKEESEDIQK